MGWKRLQVFILQVIQLQSKAADHRQQLIYAENRYEFTAVSGTGEENLLEVQRSKFHTFSLSNSRMLAMCFSSSICFI